MTITSASNLASSNEVQNNQVAILHQEAISWLEEIEFWKDELAFFYILISKPTDSDSSHRTKSLLIIEAQLIQWSAHKLVDLQKEIVTHEASLATMLQTISLSDKEIRKNHFRLSNKVVEAERQIKELKKKIYKIMKRKLSKA